MSSERDGRRSDEPATYYLDVPVMRPGMHDRPTVLDMSGKWSKNAGAMSGGGTNKKGEKDDDDDDDDDDVESVQPGNPQKFDGVHQI